MSRRVAEKDQKWFFVSVTDLADGERFVRTSDLISEGSVILECRFEAYEVQPIINMLGLNIMPVLVVSSDPSPEELVLAERIIEFGYGTGTNWIPMRIDFCPCYHLRKTVVGANKRICMAITNGTGKNVHVRAGVRYTVF